MRAPASKGNRPATRRHELAIVIGFATVFVVLWVLSMPVVRARMATRAWESGDVEGAYRLAALATRQQPEMASMWLLQARCEEHLEAPCDAALSYARAALAANEQLGRRMSEALTPEKSQHHDDVPAVSPVDGLRETAIRQALALAARCRSVSTIATVFEALTVGLPSSPENRSGIWPGSAEVAGGRPTAEALATALPAEPELQIPWIEFFWRRQRLDAAIVAAERLSAHQGSLPASGLWLIGRAMVASGRNGEAIDAFRQALRNDPGWAPAAVSLADLDPDAAAPASLDEEPLSLQSALVDAEVFDARPDVLLLATNGSVTFEVDAPSTNDRAFLAVDIRGTPANGRFPELSVFVDGEQVSALEATDPALPVIVEISPGNKTVAVSFVFGNDWADETGDRNVFFSAPKLLYARR